MIRKSDINLFISQESRERYHLLVAALWHCIHSGRFCFIKYLLFHKNNSLGKIQHVRCFNNIVLKNICTTAPAGQLCWLFVPGGGRDQLFRLLLLYRMRTTGSRQYGHLCSSRQGIIIDAHTKRPMTKRPKKKRPNDKSPKGQNVSGTKCPRDKTS